MTMEPTSVMRTPRPTLTVPSIPGHRNWSAPSITALRRTRADLPRRRADAIDEHLHLAANLLLEARGADLRASSMKRAWRSVLTSAGTEPH